MRTHSTARLSRETLLSALKWSPVFLALFCVLFVETWLQLQIYGNDYEILGLLRENKQLQERIDLLEEQGAQLNALQLIEARAPDLGLVEPEPNQIEIIRVRSESRMEEMGVRKTYARLGPDSLWPAFGTGTWVATE